MEKSLERSFEDFLNMISDDFDRRMLAGNVAKMNLMMYGVWCKWLK